MNDTADTIFSQLRNFIAHEVLDGKEIGLDGSTPLLEWGIINSFELMRLVGFIAEKLNVSIPPEYIDGQHFCDLDALTALVQRCQAHESV